MNLNKILILLLIGPFLIFGVILLTIWAAGFIDPNIEVEERLVLIIADIFTALLAFRFMKKIFSSY